MTQNAAELAQAAITAAFIEGFAAGAEAAARTITAVADRWAGTPDELAAVHRFATMTARAVRESATSTADELARPTRHHRLNHDDPRLAALLRSAPTGTQPAESPPTS